MRKKITKRVETDERWALVDEFGLQYGTQCNFGNKHEFFEAVFKDKRNAQKALKLHRDFYRGCKVVPCTITYTLPSKKSVKRKKK